MGMDLALFRITSRTREVWRMDQVFQLRRIYEDFSQLDAPLFQGIQGCCQETKIQSAAVPANVDLQFEGEAAQYFEHDGPVVLSRLTDPYGERPHYMLAQDLKNLTWHPMTNQPIIDKVLAATADNPDAVLLIWWH